MRVLILDDDAKKSIKKLMDYAHSHVLSLPMMQKTMTIELAPVGDIPDHVLYLHEGYRVVFSIETQSVGICKHLSISVRSNATHPHPAAVEQIMQEFGMGTIKEALSVWIENETAAINVLTKI